jgi:glycosyltransferase involved in cell wall biosynthesis
MKIIYHHRTGGHDGQTIHVEGIVLALRQAGHKVLVVGPPGSAPTANGTQTVSSFHRRLPPWLHELLECLFVGLDFVRLVHAVLRMRPDFIYERYNLFLPTGVWVGKILRLPVFLEVNAPLARERARHGGLAFKRLARAIERHTWRNATRVLPVTAVLAEEIGQAGVPPSRIRVIPNGVRSALLSRPASGEKVRRRYGLEERIVVGFVGYVREWHALESLIDAAAELRASRPIHVLVVGDGPGMEPALKYAAIRQAQDLITHTGIVDPAFIPEHVAAFDIAVQPAVVAYACPLKLLDYMAQGRAIVAPDSPNIRELIEAGRTGYLFAPGETPSLVQAVGALTARPELRAELGAAVRQSVIDRRLTWEHNAEIIESMAISLNRAAGRTVPAVG